MAERSNGSVEIIDDLLVLLVRLSVTCHVEGGGAGRMLGKLGDMCKFDLRSS